jgi:hypothetical protein
VAASMLACGSAVTSGDWPKLRARAGSGAHELPATPGRTDVDPLLEKLSGHLVVHGGDADLAAVVLRLLRTDRLDVPVGYVPTDRNSPVARLWGVSADPVGAALDGRAAPFPLVRDDNGGVLLGLGVLAAASGTVRGTVYCDDETPLRGQARRVEVTPDPELGVRVRVVRKALLRNKVGTARGRAVQYGGEAVTPVCDGVAHPRELRRWTWYRHTEDLLVVR